MKEITGNSYVRWWTKINKWQMVMATVAIITLFIIFGITNNPVISAIAIIIALVIAGFTVLRSTRSSAAQCVMTAIFSFTAAGLSAGIAVGLNSGTAAIFFVLFVFLAIFFTFIVATEEDFIPEYDLVVKWKTFFVSCAVEFVLVFLATWWIIKI